MSNANRKVLGEGAYGCVHKPSLHCTTLPDPNFDYDNYVSKLMKTKNAQSELQEFVTIHKYDPHDEYHLGTPKLCKPDLTPREVMKDIKKCQRIHPKLEKDPNDYSLLLLKYGGPDLKNFCKKDIAKFLKTKSQEKSDKFWLEVHHLIKGLQFFRDNGIVHNDLKPQNILYDMKKNKLSFIDFGLMRTKAEVIKSSKENKNHLANFHWSFPIECGLMNYNEYSKYRRSFDRRVLIEEELIGMIVAGNTKNTANLDIPKPDAFELFFSYINLPGTDMPAAAKYGFYDSAFNSLYEHVKLPYDEYLDKIIDTIDVYGLGFTLQYILNCFKRHNAVSEDFYTKSSALFAKMFDPEITARVTDIKTLLDEYEDILLETGVLTRLNKTFEDNNLVQRAPMPSPIMRLAEKQETSAVKLKPLSSHMERVADMDPVLADVKVETNTKACPPEKELNPTTNRCVKKCGPGQTRNAKYRCVKNKTRRGLTRSRSRSRS
uniref:Protein kinase domain-containing protein n=1 Tax=viral metagenome TaxID=1070528 RepID=A0A6C0I7B6_9ZZZZ